MNPDDKRKIIESLLFASNTPLNIQKIKNVMKDIDAREIKTAIDELQKEYDENGHAFFIKEISGGYQLFSRPEYEDYIKVLYQHKQEEKLSSAAMETLAIIAYKQPITRVEIESIRGVQSGHIIRALMEKNLIKISGKADIPGHPVLYGTTRKTLELLGLNSIKDLPSPQELA